MRVLCLGILVLFMTATAAVPGYREGMEAYNQGDYARAYEELRPLAEAGDANAQFTLAFMYDYGQGRAADPAEAARWYRRAAEQDITVAQYSLGVIYETGRGLPQDLEEAYRWYSRAVRNLASGEIRDDVVQRLESIAGLLSPEALSRAQETAAPAESSAPPPDPAPSTGDVELGHQTTAFVVDEAVRPAAGEEQDTEESEPVAAAPDVAPEPLPEPVDTTAAAGPEPPQPEPVLEKPAEAAPAETQEARKPAAEGPRQRLIDERLDSLGRITALVSGPDSVMPAWTRLEVWERDTQRLLASRFGASAAAGFRDRAKALPPGDPYGNFLRLTEAYRDYLNTLKGSP